MIKRPCLLIFGHGYTANAFADYIRNIDWEIFGTTRNSQTADLLIKKGVKPLMWSDGSKIKSVINRADYILHSIPPTEIGDPVYKRFSKAIMSRSTNLSWFGYLSTTSVYGNHDGKWVNEKSKLKPTNKFGKRRLKAEQQWQKLFKNDKKKLYILRLSGIYSDHQNVFKRIKSKQIKIVKNKNNYFSRIHLDDITQTLLNSFEKSEEDNLYNVSDDLPCPYKEIVKYACKLLKIDFNFPEINIDKIESSFLSDFYKDNKRVKNEKIKKILNVQLKYPTYKEGLHSILKKT